jgi:hypothetical protein
LTLVSAAESGANVFGIDVDKENIMALEKTRMAMDYTQAPEVCVVSILDQSFVRQHEHQFDIVHSWGVLHHTGNMTKAIENACLLVSDNGNFICSIYNRHWSSPLWKIIKWCYNVFPAPIQKVVVGIMYPVIYLSKWIVTRKDPKAMERGMDFFHNVVDWVGGYPYEYATADEIKSLVTRQGFKILRIIPAKVPTGCNEFVFKKLNAHMIPL